MKLIADGGSTKTDWRLLVDDKLFHAVQSGGINPFHLSESEIDEVLARIEFPVGDLEISHIYFYGSGISGIRAENLINSTLRKRFGSEADISVGDDLLAAARALFKNEDGIACILGTGSNSGLYRNGAIEKKIPALGYILGDEGSGADMGKRFINALFKDALPEELTKEILSKNSIDMHDVLHDIYRSELPARQLASFSKIIRDNIDHEPVKLIVEEALDDFFRKNISRYDEYTAYQLGFVGSIASYYKDILFGIAKNYGIENIKVLPAPIDELVNYHKSI